MTGRKVLTSRSRPGSDPARWRLGLALVLALLPGAAPAQETAPAAPQGNPTVELPAPFLTIDQERLFTGSAFGRRVAAEIEDRSRDLAAENGRIEAELIAEEQALTDARPTLPAEDFRAKADAFDTKVQDIRARQDAKSRALTTFRDAEQQRFATELGAVLADIAQARGALAVMDRRAMLVSADAIDITADAIAAMDAKVGDGADGAPGGPAPGDAGAAD
jgi:Skp family chaperone for outer membrane proteins